MVRFVQHEHMRQSPNHLAIVVAPCTPRKYSETSPETECLEVIIIQLRDSSRHHITGHPRKSSARAENMSFSTHARKATRP